jgi:dTDP-4-dehydrorhamnose 3,5-epimerase
VPFSIDMPYSASAARGIRWNDPAVKINWPEPITFIFERDLQFPDWKP